MESDLVNTILRVCGILNRHSIQYMVVGGAAVALHGYYRHSVNLWGEVTVSAESPVRDSAAFNILLPNCCNENRTPKCATQPC